MFQHTFNQNLIFFISPFIMLDPMIEMIQPSLSTLFAGSEKFPLWNFKQINHDLVPLWI